MPSSPRGYIQATVLSLLALVVIGVGGWYAWSYFVNNSATITFKTEKVVIGNLTATINATGTIEPEEVIDVGAQVNGKVESFGKVPGIDNKSIDYCTLVTKGTLLAQLDARLYQAAKDRAEATWNKAKATLEKSKATLEMTKADLALQEADYAQKRAEEGRFRTLSKTGAATASDIDVAVAAAKTSEASVRNKRAAIEVARQAVNEAEKAIQETKADLDIAETNLGYTKIISPVDGVIVDRRVNVGQTVVASLNAPSLFLIAKDLKRLQVWASVNEADIGAIQNSGKDPMRVIQRGTAVGLFGVLVSPPTMATFTVDAYPRDTFKGLVSQIRLNATMTQNVVTYTVVVDTHNDDGSLLPYMTANVQFIVSERRGVLLVPNTALRYRPKPDRILPSELDAYQQSARKKMKSQDGAPSASEKVPANQAWIFVEDNGYARPIRIRTGLTDGRNTEVVEVLDGAELKPQSPVITGEIVGRKGDSSVNPFAPKPIFGSKKKE